MSSNSLPLILISAKDPSNASYLISEIIKNEKAEIDDKETNSSVWKVENKYYNAMVQLYPLADGDLVPSTVADRLEAHIIYVAENEVEGEAAEDAERRLTAAEGAARAEVRLLAVAGERTPLALQQWARRRRYEPVALREAPAPEDDAAAPFAETYGVDRLRAALHAHAWPGLARRDRPARPAPLLDDHPAEVNSSDEEYAGRGSGAEGSGDEADVELAEQFAEALGALGAAREAAPRLSPAQRRARAERLVHAFCRALGHDVHSL